MITFNVTPIGKPRMTQRDKWKKRPVVNKYYEFKDELKAQAAKNGFKESGAFHISFFIPMPASWSKKKKAEMVGKPHQEKPDIDNLLKAFMDCLYSEDKSVYFVNTCKYWTHSEGGSIQFEPY